MLGHNRDRRMITIVFDIVFLACFFCAATVTAFASSGKIDVSPDNMAYISVIYGVVCSVSLILLICQSCLIRDKDVRLNLLFVSVLLCNIGYFALSISSTLEEALLANRIAYLGSVFLIFFMAADCVHMHQHRSISDCCQRRILRHLLQERFSGNSGWCFKAGQRVWFSALGVLFLSSGVFCCDDCSYNHLTAEKDGGIL